MIQIKSWLTGASWSAPATTRRGTSRATKVAARAKLVHTSHQTRQIVICLTKPLMDRLGWVEGGFISPLWSVDDHSLRMLLKPGHKGLRAAREKSKSSTCRIVISGDFISRSACAPIREVPYEISADTLMLSLPKDWAAMADLRAGAAADPLP